MKPLSPPPITIRVPLIPPPVIIREPGPIAAPSKKPDNAVKGLFTYYYVLLIPNTKELYQNIGYLLYFILGKSWDQQLDCFAPRRLDRLICCNKDYIVICISYKNLSWQVSCQKSRRWKKILKSDLMFLLWICPHRYLTFILIIDVNFQGIVQWTKKDSAGLLPLPGTHQWYNI